MRSLFWYLPGFDHFFGPCPNSILFQYLPGFDHSFGNRPNPYPVLTLIRSLFQCLPRFDHFSDTCLDSITFLVLAWIRPFFGTCLDSIILLVIARTLFRYSPGSISYVSYSLVLARIRSLLFQVLQYLLRFDPLCFLVLRYSLGSIPFLLRWFSGITLESSSPFVSCFQH